MDINEQIDARLKRSRSIFELFGHAITVVTWISFCAVAIFSLANMLMGGTGVHLSGRNPLVLVILIAGFMAAASSAFLFWHLAKLVFALQSDAEQTGSKVWRRIMWHLDGYLAYGFLALTGCIAGLLARQAALSLGLISP